MYAYTLQRAMDALEIAGVDMTVEHLLGMAHLVEGARQLVEQDETFNALYKIHEGRVVPAEDLGGDSNLEKAWEATVSNNPNSIEPVFLGESGENGPAVSNNPDSAEKEPVQAPAPVIDAPKP